MLIEAGAKLDNKNDDGKTALMYAAMEGYNEIT
jgi:ankyrin repeat protein